MDKHIDDYTASEFAKQLKRIQANLQLGKKPQTRPMAFLLGGQSGAGKTRLQRVIMEQHGYDFIVINGDEYRKSHPRSSLIQQQYGIEAPAHTARWSGQMVEALIDAFSQQGYHLVVEGTLRTSQVPLETAKLLRGRGYAVSLALMAVKPEISLVSCQLRYEQMRIAGTTPRAVDPSHHQAIVRDICDNLQVLETSGMFDQVQLYNRAGVCLLAAEYRGDSETPPASQDAPASAALRDVLFGSWTKEEEEHYRELSAQLAALQEQ